MLPFHSGNIAQTRQFLTPLASLSHQPQPRSLLHRRVLLQGSQREVQRGVGVRSPGHVQRREPPVPHLRAQGQLHRLPRRDASLPQRGERRAPLRLRRPVAIVTSGCQSSRVLLLPRRAAPAPSVRSTGSRRAPVPARMARMRRSSVTFAAWRRVSHFISFTSVCSTEQRFSR